MNKEQIGILALSLCAGMAAAGDPEFDPASGLDFVTITDVGNRDTNEFEVPLGPEVRIGGVEYEYRISTTEVTVKEYIKFVELTTRFTNETPGLTLASSISQAHESSRAEHRCLSFLDSQKTSPRIWDGCMPRDM